MPRFLTNTQPTTRLSSARRMCAIGFGVMAVCLAAMLASASAQMQTPQKDVPTAPEDANPAEPLSDKLSRNQGVIRPPADVDPKIHTEAPNPDPQTTPVIPPPGSPGGNQDVQPK
jgi:hypothetical protein